MSYPEQVAEVARMLKRPPLCGAEQLLWIEDGETKATPSHPPATLVIDETGVGRAVGDFFEKAGLKPQRITITAGLETSQPGPRTFHVPKATLIQNLDARLHSGELKFAAALSDAPARREELRDFTRSVSSAGRNTFEARVGKHDDLVLAVAISLLRSPDVRRFELADQHRR
jgi:hypothetical protein